MHTILIADREPSHRQQIRRHIDSRPGFRVIGECGNCHAGCRATAASAQGLM